MTVRLTNHPPGLRAARFVIAIVRGKGMPGRALEIAEREFADTPTVAMAIKGAVTGMTLASDAAFESTIGGDFVAAVRSATVIDRLKGVRRVGFATDVPRETAAGFGAAWVGNGIPTPNLKTASDSFRLDHCMASGMFVWTVELDRLIQAGDALALREALVASAAAYLDGQFLNPTVSAVTGLTPAAITNGATQITQTGTTALAKMADFQSMIDAITTELVAPCFIMHRKEAIRIGNTLTTGGALAFPSLHAMGGSLMGIPVMTSSAVPEVGSPTARPIVLVDADGIALADEGRAEIITSKFASIQMDNAPTNNAGTGTGSSTVSMFQTGSIAVKHNREINWTRALSGSVAYMLATY